MKSFLTVVAMLPLIACAKETTVSSPNGKLQIIVSDQNGLATYAVKYDGQQALLPSALGFKADYADFTQGLTITNSKTGKAEDTYEMRQVKHSKIHYTASTLTVDFENAKKQKMQVEFFVKDNDLAFRYIIPRPEKNNPKCAYIESEKTAFNLPQQTTTFICPQIDPMKGWERTKPSYEEEYTPDDKMNVKSKCGQGYTFPCLCRG